MLSSSPLLGQFIEERVMVDLNSLSSPVNSWTDVSCVFLGLQYLQNWSCLLLRYISATPQSGLWEHWFDLLISLQANGTMRISLTLQLAAEPLLLMKVQTANRRWRSVNAAMWMNFSLSGFTLTSCSRSRQELKTRQKPAETFVLIDDDSLSDRWMAQHSSSLFILLICLLLDICVSCQHLLLPSSCLFLYLSVMWPTHQCIVVEGTINFLVSDGEKHPKAMRVGGCRGRIGSYTQVTFHWLFLHSNSGWGSWVL